MSKSNLETAPMENMFCSMWIPHANKMKMIRERFFSFDELVSGKNYHLVFKVNDKVCTPVMFKSLIATAKEFSWRFSSLNYAHRRIPMERWLLLLAIKIFPLLRLTINFFPLRLKMNFYG